MKSIRIWYNRQPPPYECVYSQTINTFPRPTLSVALPVYKLPTTDTMTRFIPARQNACCQITSQAKESHMLKLQLSPTPPNCKDRTERNRNNESLMDPFQPSRAASSISIIQIFVPGYPDQIPICLLTPINQPNPNQTRPKPRTVPMLLPCNAAATQGPIWDKTKSPAPSWLAPLNSLPLSSWPFFVIIMPCVCCVPLICSRTLPIRRTRRRARVPSQRNTLIRP